MLNIYRIENNNPIYGPGKELSFGLEAVALDVRIVLILNYGIEILIQISQLKK